jgi:hypothetical protein
MKSIFSRLRRFHRDGIPLPLKKSLEAGYQDRSNFGNRPLGSAGSAPDRRALPDRSRPIFTLALPIAVLLTTAFLLILPLPAASNAVPDAANAVPILVELFTSEGCSSCPPADDMVRDMDATQPFAGTRVIVLSEHVDYWDREGWKDRYSSFQFTERQSAYVRALGLSTAYTPQIIIDGSKELKGSLSDVALTVEKEAAIPKLSVRIGSAKIESTTELKARIEVDASEQKHGADVFLAVALDHAESQISSGENSGRHLQHVAVLAELKKIGRIEKGKKFTQDTTLKLKPGIDPTNVRVIAFVQEFSQGKVLGAAELKLGD